VTITPDGEPLVAEPPVLVPPVVEPPLVEPPGTGELLARDDFATVAEGGSVAVQILDNDSGPIDRTYLETNVQPKSSRGYIVRNGAR